MRLDRLAPSVTVTWMVAVPSAPRDGVRVSVQVPGALPQLEGATTALKIAAVTVTLSVPIPPIVKGSGCELLPPTMVVPCNPLMVGAGSAPARRARRRGRSRRSYLERSRWGGARQQIGIDLGRS